MSLFSSLNYIFNALVCVHKPLIFRSVTIKQVSPVRVPHTGSSWAYIVRGRRIPAVDKDWSIVYSGDTTPCGDLIEAGRDCDLLIHEATMVDEHEDLAVRAKHR